MRRIALALAITLVAPVLFAQETYFPKGTLSSNARSDLFLAKWYSAQLKALDEPSFPELAKNSSLQAYRFTWLRTFHHPVAIRVEMKVDGTAVLSLKVASGAGGYEPGKLIQNTSRQLTRDEATKFLDKVEEANWWSLRAYEEDPPNVYHLDGSHWIIEGIKDGDYHVVDRWSPRKGSVRELGLIALEFAQMNVPNNELY